ncbi:NAD-dependent epimerase/dehydratase family protein [Streptomyces sp. WAC05292]|uniref:NAD-dependent epimerase/dehydratase family protein n=1 Tax=Streptomyces sp. WAC05292 TaxID=2487418 RepID=UPI000F7389D3|nr:NAD-dependent epimerase/dehydratase family protein [Streptomyces sp. WAC05292]RSS92589.1 NAD-dependent epimerase/dehydratase family protein [Streptomyces sp. WAC05292]
MRVVVTGATGNTGTSVVRALAADLRVADVVGIARRRPALDIPGVRWVAADVDPGHSDLTGLFEGAAAVVHLAWKFQPTHDPVETWRTNVLGGIRVFEACARAGVRTLVHASSVGAYAPGPPDGRPVDETWPTHGWPGAAYTREKAYLERCLDGFQPAHPEMRVVRMRPAFLFKEAAASEQRRIFAGPLLPWWLVRPGLLPALPAVTGLRFQALHTDDAAQAYREAVFRPVRGAFNLVADPVLDMAAVARLLHARTVPLPAGAARAALAAAWRMRLIPAAPGLLDAFLRLPLLDAGRAREQLDWTPSTTATEAVADFLTGLRHGAGLETPPLAAAGTPARRHER